MAENNIEFVDGLLVKAPNPKAPDFVKAQISIKVEDLGKWLREKYKAGNEWVNLDIKEAKTGRWYASVSTFKPKENSPTKGRQDMRAKPSSEDPDIPFAQIRKVEASLL
jgi:hypothetical protein